MKSIQTLIALLLGAGCLVMAVMTVRTSRANAAKQNELQQLSAAVQAEVRQITSTEQVSRNVLTDLGNAAVTNESIRAMLAKNGYTLTPNQPPAGAEALPVVIKQPAPVAPKTEVVTPPVSAPVEAKEVKKEDKP